MPTQLQAHCQIPTSQRFNQSFVKELAMPTHGRQAIAANWTDKMIKNKNSQCLTSGHKTLGVKWLIERSVSHQSSVSGDRDAAPKSPTFHTANRYCDTRSHK